MSWSRDEVQLLIEEYQKWPNLYQVKTSNYKNRNLRRRALEAVCNTIKVLKPAVTIPEIQSKFQALKQNATKEHKKYVDSQRSGAGLEDIVEPSLWYYPLMRFVFDQCEQRGSIDSMEDTPFEETITTVIEEDDGDITAEEVFSAVVSPSGQLEEAEVPSRAETPQNRSSSKCSMLSGASQPGPSRKRKKSNNDDTIFGQVQNTLQCISHNLQSDNIKIDPPSPNKQFGKYVVSKLDKIQDDSIRDDLETEILILVNNALKKYRKTE